MSKDGLYCKRCGGADYAKSRRPWGHQRYCCRDCGFHFIGAPLPSKPPTMKALAVLLYGMGNMSFNAIGRLLGVSDVAVLKWIPAEASALPEPEVVTVAVDEMRHFIKKKSAKRWICRAHDVGTRRVVAWVLGQRDDATCRRLPDKAGVSGKTFITDDWEGYHRVIPEDQLFTGKDLTFPIEQDNSNVRHDRARFRRRTKVVSRCRTMVDLSLRLLDPVDHGNYAKKFLAIFGWKSRIYDVF